MLLVAIGTLELISGLDAVDHVEEFNGINLAFVRAEHSFFALAPGFRSSLWRRRCAERRRRRLFALIRGTERREERIGVG